MNGKPYFRSRLIDGQNVFGTWCIIPSPETVNIVARSGVSFVYIDLDHGAADSVTVQRMIVAAQAEGCAAIVRVSENSEANILHALDCGADGILVPHVDTRADCVRALDAMYYPPEGTRGYSPYVRSGSYSVQKGYTAEANRNLLSGILIEGAAAVGDISSIINDPRLDFVYIGTYDISVHLGVPGETKHPEVVDVLRRCAATIRNHGKIAACLFNHFDELPFFAEAGVSMLAYKVDTAVLYDGFSKIMVQ